MKKYLSSFLVFSFLFTIGAQTVFADFFDSDVYTDVSPTAAKANDSISMIRVDLFDNNSGNLDHLSVVGGGTAVEADVDRVLLYLDDDGSGCGGNGGGSLDVTDTLLGYTGSTDGVTEAFKNSPTKAIFWTGSAGNGGPGYGWLALTCPLTTTETYFVVFELASSPVHGDMVTAQIQVMSIFDDGTSTDNNGNSSMLTSIIVDVNGPNMTSWDLDKDAGTLTMTFDENVDASTLDVTGMKLMNDADQGSASHTLTLSSATTSSSDGTSIVLDLSDSELDDLKLNNSSTCGGTGTSDCYLSITSSVIDDLVGNAVTAISSPSAQEANSVTDDTTKPTVDSATLDYNDGTLVVTFDEPVDALSADETYFHINDVTGADDVTLSQATTSSDGRSLTFTLTEAERGDSIGISGTAGGDGGAVVLDVDSRAVADMDGNSILDDDNNTVTETADTTDPAQVTGFAINSHTSSTVDLGWTAATTDFDHYEVYYSETSGVTNTTGTLWGVANDAALDTIGTNSTTVTGLTSNTTYYFTIYVSDPAGNLGTAAAEISQQTESESSGGGVALLGILTPTPTVTPATTTTTSTQSTTPTVTTSTLMPFKDLIGHWSEPYVEFLYGLGVVKGITDTQYDPEGTITRAELLKMIIDSFGYDVELVTENPYSDVSASMSYAPYIAKAKMLGFVHGYEDGTFRPNNSVSRVEALVMVLQSSGLDVVGSESSFPDTSLGVWYSDFLSYALDNGVISGYATGLFGPADDLTRAQAAKIIVETYSMI